LTLFRIEEFARFPLEIQTQPDGVKEYANAANDPWSESKVKSNNSYAILDVIQKYSESFTKVVCTSFNFSNVIINIGNTSAKEVPFPSTAVTRSRRGERIEYKASICESLLIIHFNQMQAHNHHVYTPRGQTPFFFFHSSGILLKKVASKQTVFSILCKFSFCLAACQKDNQIRCAQHAE
ncbi:MAG: hypothetical protein EZS28_039159, partial [Streblomastix strix]